MKSTQTKNELAFRFRGIELLLTNPENGVWRLQSKKNGLFDKMGAAQTLSKDLGEEYDIAPAEFQTAEENGVITAAAGDGSCVVITPTVIGFYNAKGILKRSVKKIEPGKDETSVILSLSPDERLYGTGERFNRVNQRGKRVQIYAIDRWCQTEGNSYIPIPFVISSGVSGVFMNRYEHSVFDIGLTVKNQLKITQKYAPADLYIFLNETPGEILAAYSRLTGFAPVPPDWAFGTLVCRYHPEFQTKGGIYAMAEAMEKNDFPWDAVITEGWGAYKTEKRADLKEVSDRVHAMGKKMMVYEQCGKFPSNYEEFGLEDKYAVQSDSGVELKETRSMNLLDNFHHKKMRCVDITDPECYKKWEEVWDELVHGIGVDGAKIDFCEQFPDKPIIHFADGRDPMAAHHWFPTFYNVLRYKHFNTRPDGGVNFSRGGGIGAQRYPYVWAGDQRREFYFLKAVIKAALSLGLSGVPFVSWDMAGYQPSFNPYDKIHEDRVFLRGLEFTAFSPVIQTHGRIKRPYDFDEFTMTVYRAYAKLHDALRPYLREQAEVSSKTGLPMMRHLFLYDPADEKCLDIDDEYMLGCGLLVAPVLNDAHRRNIYLPKGTWVNIFTGEKFAGGKLLKGFHAGIEAVPVFRLEGAESEALLPALAAGDEYIRDLQRLKS